MVLLKPQRGGHYQPQNFSIANKGNYKIVDLHKDFAFTGF